MHLCLCHHPASAVPSLPGANTSLLLLPPRIPWLSRGVFLCPKMTTDQPWMKNDNWSAVGDEGAQVKSSMRIQGAHLPCNSFECHRIHSFYHQTGLLEVKTTEKSMNPCWSGKLCHRETGFWRAECSWGKEIWCVAFGERKFNKKAVMNFSFGKSACRSRQY